MTAPDERLASKSLPARVWDHVRQAPPAQAADVDATLWNGSVAAADYTPDGAERYQAAILEQYKLYVEMADRVSSRRGLANTFFLTLNTAILTAVGVFWKDRPTVDQWVILFPAAVLVLQCLAWFWIIRSYRQLNSGKWAVVGALEAHLPASPFWRAEWKALGEGKDPARYWPLTHVEQWVPFLFALAYVGGACAVILT